MIACIAPQQKSEADHTDASFILFAGRFLDAYWKQNPAAAIAAGYGKYYELLKIPDSVSFAGDCFILKKIPRFHCIF
jgi:hypothetical protein